MTKQSKICPECGKRFDQIGRHFKSQHSDKVKEHEDFILKCYNDGQSCAKIAEREDVIFSKSVIVRLIRDNFSKEEVEEKRRQHISATNIEENANGNRDHIKEINTARVQSEEGRRKNSEGLKKACADGRRKPWNEGKNKFSDPRIKKYAEKVSKTHTEKYRSMETKPDYLFFPGDQAPTWKGGISEEYRKHRYKKEFNRADRNCLKRKFKSCCNCRVTEQVLSQEKDKYSLPRWDLECDHIVPIIKGGSGDSKTNGQMLCSYCHLLKSMEERGLASDNIVEKYKFVIEARNTSTTTLDMTEEKSNNEVHEPKLETKQHEAFSQEEV